jgi:hypothetical protein
MRLTLSFILLDSACSETLSDIASIFCSKNICHLFLFLLPFTLVTRTIVDGGRSEVDQPDQADHRICKNGSRIHETQSR